MDQPHNPESQERFRPVTRSELKGAGGGLIVGGLGNVLVSLQLTPEGLTTEKKDDLLDDAYGRIETNQAVHRDARQNNTSDARATVRYTGRQIKQAKQEIVAISARKPTDTVEDYAETFGWGALVGVVAVTALVHGTRRAKFAWRRWRSKP